MASILQQSAALTARTSPLVGSSRTARVQVTIKNTHIHTHKRNNTNVSLLCCFILIFFLQRQNIQRYYKQLGNVSVKGEPKNANCGWLVSGKICGIFYWDLSSFLTAESVCEKVGTSGIGKEVVLCGVFG